MNMIEEIKNKIYIKDLVQEEGILTYSSDFIKSIYKDEKNPSLKLYPQTNSFYDFSTGRGGDVLTFYADLKKLNLKQAVKELALKAGNINARSHTGNAKSGLVIKEPTTLLLMESEREHFEEIAAILEYSEGVIRAEAEQQAYRLVNEERISIRNIIYEELEKWCNGIDEETAAYLLGPERGLTEDSIQRSRLFSIKDKGKTIDSLNGLFTKDQLLISGLFSNKGRFVFEEHKLIIPFIGNGRLNYLRGRILPNSLQAGEGYRYMSLYNNTNDLTSKRFYNSDILYELEPGAYLLICEGEFDVIRAIQQGLPAIGIPGVNNFPTDKVSYLKLFNIHLIFDNDQAGRSGMRRVASIMGKKIKAIHINKNKDLTEYLNERFQS